MNSAKSALFIYGGWQGHQPDITANYFASCLRDKGYTVELSESLDTLLDSAKLHEKDLIVPVWTNGELTPDQEKGLLSAVANGVGLAAWHGAAAAFYTNVKYHFMLGGSWVAHPGDIIDYRVNIIDHNDPIMSGITDFSMHSEQYYLHIDPTNQVLATTTFAADFTPWIAGAVIPVVWKRTWDKGRVFYSSLGHVPPDFDVPEVREIMLRGMLWATRSVQ